MGRGEHEGLEAGGETLTMNGAKRGWSSLVSAVIGSRCASRAVIFGAACACSAALGLAPGSASAQARRAVIVAAGGDEGLPEAAWIAAAEGIERGARQWGLEIVPRSGPLRLRGCAPADCVAAEQERAGVDLVIAFSLFAAIGAPREPGSVAVSLRSAGGTEHGASAEIDGREIGLVAGLALTAARREIERASAGPWLIVRGRPEGAVVIVDGADMGTLPLWEGGVRAGAHRVLVELAGYHTYETEVSIGAGEEPLELWVDLASASPASGATNGSAWPSYVLGSALLGAGLLLTIPSWVTLARDGECGSLDGAGCLERYRFEESIGWMIAGGLIAIGGIVVLAAQPIWVSAAPVTGGMRLDMRGSF